MAAQLFMAIAVVSAWIMFGRQRRSVVNRLWHPELKYATAARPDPAKDKANSSSERRDYNRCPAPVGRQ